MANIIIVLILVALVGYGIYSYVHHLTHGGGCCGERDAAAKKVKVEDHNKAHYPHTLVMGVDGMVTATSTVEKLNKAFEKKHISIRDIDFVTPLWEGRPAAPATPAWLLDVKYAGKTAAEKLAQLRSLCSPCGKERVRR